MIVADPGVDSEGLAACERLLQQQSLASIRFFKQTDSTNSQAMQELDSASWTLPRLHLADDQTAGRGRQGRSWIADDGTLTFTLSIADSRFADTNGEYGSASLPLPLTVGLALARTIEQFTDGVQPRLKWPNDVYLAERKLAGILIESSVKRPDVRVIGVGINVATRTADLLNDLDPSSQLNNPAKPISIIEQCTRHPRRYQWLQPCIENILQCIAESFHQADSMINEYRQRCLLTHGEIHCIVGHRTHTGICEGIDPYGRLMIRSGSQLITLSSGEVTKVRRNA